MSPPSVLFVYYTYTQQTRKVAEAMTEVLRGRGCNVTLAAIEFTDPRYTGRFSQFPMPHPFLEVLGMIPAELRRRPAKIGIPGVVTERDAVCRGCSLPPVLAAQPENCPAARNGARRPVL